MAQSTELTAKQRKQLRALAHSLKPVVMMGQHGLTDAVVAATDDALDQHELIKIKLAGSERDERKQLMQTICDRCQAQPVVVIGATAIIYRPHPQQPVIKLKKD